MYSTFFTAGPRTRTGDFASLHLSRDQLLSVKLATIASKIEDQGYAEGVVTNTKFGSFPHSTLINIPWGSQVLASKVDTGSRGRGELKQSRKRKANAISADALDGETETPFVKQATIATSGFIHVLPPTPESWTTSLPHRTQVVYTPDYSYILHRIRARPGSTIIEAGSGSGSFTHAAARAVFQGAGTADAGKESSPVGKVFTFEFHMERHAKVKSEMTEHGLDSVVTATHRDVYREGFWLKSEDGQLSSPKASSIFLDLPAPWEALEHLTREDLPGRPSALNPSCAAYICTFSPCIEQVQKTVSVMRKQGWIEIEMIEINHKRVDVRREYTGMKFEGMRGVNAVAATVDEALARLNDIEKKTRDHQGESNKKEKDANNASDNKQQSAVQIHWDEGRLVHRSEPDLKTHTSYLVFAVLPREWTDDDELRQRSLNVSQPVAPQQVQKSYKQLKKDDKQRKNQTNGSHRADGTVAI